MEPWAPLLVSHVVAALSGVLLGGYQLWRRPRGDARHRILGRVWVVLLLWAAVSSFWIRHLNAGDFSWLHVLSVVTVVSVVLGVVNARIGRVRAHRGNMVGSWLGAVGALVFAVAIPDRLIPTFAVENPAGAAGFALSVAASTVLVVALGTWLSTGVEGRRRPA